MNISMDIHAAVALRIQSHSPDNSNQIGLEIVTKNGSVTFHVYDLPAEITRKLMRAFADDNTYGTFRRDDEEPEPLDAETIAARRAMYESYLIAAGRGHLAGE